MKPKNLTVFTDCACTVQRKLGIVCRMRYVLQIKLCCWCAMAKFRIVTLHILNVWTRRNVWTMHYMICVCPRNLKERFNYVAWRSALPLVKTAKQMDTRRESTHVGIWFHNLNLPSSRISFNGSLQLCWLYIILTILWHIHLAEEYMKYKTFRWVCCDWLSYRKFLLFYVLNFVYLKIRQQPGYLSGVALGYGLDDREFESRKVVGIYLFTTVCRPSWGPPSLVSNGYHGLFT
jgi:hypothetical protein